MKIVSATIAYEDWLGRFCSLDPDDVQHKHDEMRKASDPFPFFRGTYYRWVQHWQASRSDLLKAPQVLAVGDLHLENFGTWRDAEGRLCWGVNDFDEADTLPYTNDLARLAASVRFDRESSLRELSFGDVCRAILGGYRESLEEGGKEFVLEEGHKELREMATSSERAPARFWEKLSKLIDHNPEVHPPVKAREALVRSLPPKASPPQFRFRARAGMGSLGKPRYVALSKWAGGYVCREAKKITPPRDGVGTRFKQPGRIETRRRAEGCGAFARSLLRTRERLGHTSPCPALFQDRAERPAFARGDATLDRDGQRNGERSRRQFGEDRRDCERPQATPGVVVGGSREAAGRLRRSGLEGVPTFGRMILARFLT